MKKIVAMILTATVFAAMLSGCGSTKPAEEQNTDSTIKNEATSPEETTSPEGTTSPTDTPNNANAQKNLTEIESDFGYKISYPEDIFSYQRAEGTDDFSLKPQDDNKPYVFMCITRIGAKSADVVKAEYLGNSPEVCTIGQAQIQGQCSETEEAWANGNTINKNYVYPLDSGDILLIETQWYTEQAENTYSAQLSEMINTIQIL